MDWVFVQRETIDVVNMSLGGGDATTADQNPCGWTTTPLHNAICEVVTGGAGHRRGRQEVTRIQESRRCKMCGSEAR
jgi:hypothetical protein